MRFFPLLLSVMAPTLAFAWPLNGVRVTGAFDIQGAPRITSDGTGGAFIAWQDLRDYFSGIPNSRTDCYLQRVTASGQIAPGWPQDGVVIAVGPGHQFPEQLLPDGTGGVLVLYSDTRLDFGDLYLQRITAAGVVSPGWPAAGVPVGTGPGEQWTGQLVWDGTGGAFVSWQDGDGGSKARYAHVLASGVLAPGWPANGRLFEPGPFLVSRPLMLRSGSGFLAAWAVCDNGDCSLVHVRARRFLEDGSPDPAWPAGGTVICSSLPFSRGPVERLVSDEAGGFFTILQDYRASTSVQFESDLYAQHVLANGTIAPGWPADALPISANQGVEEQDATICEDGAGGAFFAWDDLRSGYVRIFAQHLRPDGQPHAGWPLFGKSLTGPAGFQVSPELAWDGWTGAYVTWNTLEAGGYRSYVQHLRPDGTWAIGWPPNGLPVIPLATGQYVPRITADGLGGAIVAWEDTRNDETDVYAQKFVGDGVVATQVSLAEAEADAGEVRIRWHVSGETRANVERREGAGEWRVLTELTADGSGYLNLMDHDVRPGTSYDYRLAFASGTRGGDVTLDVPAAFVLALEGTRPNPSAGPLWVSFTLPGAEPARLELFDLSGRRLSARDVGTRGAGRHLVRLDDGSLHPGLYWASLTQGARTLRTRVAVVR